MIKSGEPSSARVRESANINLPSASVFPISTVKPDLEFKISPGLKELLEIEFSAIGINTLKFKFSLFPIIIFARPNIFAAPPISFFIRSIPDEGLISKPPVSKVMPFPTSVTFGSFFFPH